MAQLIKMLDYISRYESNPFHYPTQYIRLKQENWKKITNLWELENEQSLNNRNDNKEVNERARSFRWNSFFRKKEKNKDDVEQFVRTLPETKEQLTQYFLNELFTFQLKWASSTISQVSFTDSKYNHDPLLKTFLQRLPDIYLLMYYPIFNVKNAPIEGDIVLISPIGIEIISIMNKTPEATIVINDERTWTIETKNNEEKVLSPNISLKRTEQIIRSILNHHSLDMRINKLVMSQTNDFLYSVEPYNTTIIGKSEYEDWLFKKRSLTSPLKSSQLKTIDVLLRQCQTTSVRRPEWENDEDDTYMTAADYEEK